MVTHITFCDKPFWWLLFRYRCCTDLHNILIILSIHTLYAVFLNTHGVYTTAYDIHTLERLGYNSSGNINILEHRSCIRVIIIIISVFCVFDIIVTCDILLVTIPKPSGRIIIIIISHIFNS